MNARLPLQAALLALGLLALVASGAARAELYKWVDEKGNVTYSQVPPPDREATTVAPPPPVPDNPGPSAKKPAKGDESADERAQAEEDARVDKEIAKVNKKNCEIAKRNLGVYKIYSRIRNEKGELTVLDDKTRAEKIKQAEKDIKDYCK